MADTDDRNDDAAPAQGSAVEFAPPAKQDKRSLRRRVIAADQTALSSSVASLPSSSDPVPLPATDKLSGSSMESDSTKAFTAETTSVAVPGAKGSSSKFAPTKSSAPLKPAKVAKPKAAKPSPISQPSKPVAAKPLPPQHVATAKAQPAKALPATPAAPLAPQPLSAAKPAVAPLRTLPEVSIAATATQSEFKPKDKTMDMSANFSSFQDAISDAQAKAQAAFEKSSTVFGEVGEFAKGNVEAVIASGKILAEGVQEIGGTIVAEGRTAFESMTGDIKELAAAKSPTDFLKLQSDMVRKNFDSAVAYGYSLDQFVANAREEPGSWWNHWRGWLETLDPATVPAKGKRVPGGRGDRVIEDAPGRYVAMR